MANPLVELRALISKPSVFSGTVTKVQDDGLIFISTNKGIKKAGLTSGLSVQVGDKVTVENGAVYVSIRKHTPAKVYQV